MFPSADSLTSDVVQTNLTAASLHLQCCPFYLTLLYLEHRVLDHSKCSCSASPKHQCIADLKAAGLKVSCNASPSVMRMLFEQVVPVENIDSRYDRARALQISEYQLIRNYLVL